MFLRIALCLLLGTSVSCTVSDTEADSGTPEQQRRGHIQGFDAPVASEDGAYAFRWIAGPVGQKPVEVQILEVTEVATGTVVYTNDDRFRSRDVNVAAWASQPTTLLAYSGDVGTITIRPDESGIWSESDNQGCLAQRQLDELDEEVSKRLPAC